VGVMILALIDFLLSLRSAENGTGR
jgi:hypothetical protein